MCDACDCDRGPESTEQAGSGHTRTGRLGAERTVEPPRQGPLPMQKSVPLRFSGPSSKGRRRWIRHSPLPPFPLIVVVIGSQRAHKFAM